MNSGGEDLVRIVGLSPRLLPGTRSTVKRFIVDTHFANWDVWDSHNVETPLFLNQVAGGGN